ncbi:macro domain-containing protein [Paenibacillus terrae]|uniref:macro domain-containing protein n=1 Tax=Paenibacillus terrae TaxID=159743 RepID=UPI0006971A06|nr:macro domain-containing protein [Paenibacillus terrae]
MITYVKTNIFESPAQVLVNTVNTVGVMGKGIAKQFKDIYPEMFKQYQTFCERKLLDVGKLWVYKTPHKWILNFPTKKHWRSPSKIEYIEMGLQKFVETYAEKGIYSISFPLLGCGNGGLDWETEVKPLMESYLKPLPIDVFIHLADRTNRTEHTTILETQKWLWSEPSLLSFNEVWDDINSLIEDDLKLIVGDSEYRVTLVEDTDISLNFISSQKTLNITQDQFFDLWRQLRTVGFCSMINLPESLYNISAVVFNLLSRLRYVEPVEMAHRLENKSDLRYGIRLLPHLGYNKQSYTEEIVDAAEK